MTLLFPTRDPLGLRSSPIEAQAKSPYNSIRKPSGAFHPSPRLRRTKWCVGCGCVVVCLRFPSGLARPLLATVSRLGFASGNPTPTARANSRLKNASPPRPMGVAARVIPDVPLLVRPPSGAAALVRALLVPTAALGTSNPAPPSACALIASSLCRACPLRLSGRSRSVVCSSCRRCVVGASLRLPYFRFASITRFQRILRE